jgi:hypothetical protein
MALTAKRRTAITAITAVHEAAHAVAACRYKFGFQVVHVTLGAPIVDRRGRSIRALGFHEGGYFNEHKIWSHVSQSSAGPVMGSDGQLIDFAALQRENGFRAMVIDLAGPVAEARRKRWSLAAVYLSYGRDDFDEALAIAKYLASDAADERTLFDAAEAEAKRCLSQFRDAINDLAQTLIERLSVEFDDAPASVHAVPRLEDRIAPDLPRLHAGA